MMHATDVAARLALKRYPRSWRGRCPCCDYTGNTFIVRASKAGWARLYCANGCSGDELEAVVAHATGQQEPDRHDRSDDADRRERNQERALALWRGSEPAIGTLADKYLTARGLAGLAESSALRFRGDTPHPEGGRLAAMIALVTGPTGTPLGVHRTFLDRDGSKARIEPAKASLGPIWRGAIRLEPLITHMPLVVGEGIESSASAGRLMGLPAWAAVSAGNLAKGLLLPPEVPSVVIGADADRAGERAATAAALRWSAEGRFVQIARPTSAGGDFNDLLLTRDSANG